MLPKVCLTNHLNLSCLVSDVGTAAQPSWCCLQFAGIVIAPIAVLFMLYALWMYKKRTVQILRRQTVRFDDQIGPVLLVVLLLAATISAIILTAISANL